jgi:hypothetical protein
MLTLCYRNEAQCTEFKHFIYSKMVLWMSIGLLRVQGTADICHSEHNACDYYYMCTTEMEVSGLSSGPLAFLTTAPVEWCYPFDDQNLFMLHKCRQNRWYCLLLPSAQLHMYQVQLVFKCAMFLPLWTSRKILMLFLFILKYNCPLKLKN